MQCRTKRKSLKRGVLMEQKYLVKNKIKAIDAKVLVSIILYKYLLILVG
jgi:hypothetical protein